MTHHVRSQRTPNDGGRSRALEPPTRFLAPTVQDNLCPKPRQTAVSLPEISDLTLTTDAYISTSNGSASTNLH